MKASRQSKKESAYLHKSYLNYISGKWTGALPWTVRRLLSQELTKSDVVLDIGCGPKSRLSDYDVSYSVGVEVFDPYIEEAKKAHTHDELIKADCTTLEIKPKSFDVVLALDVMEHLGKQDSICLLDKMKSWARKKVIITTPNGFSPGHPADGNIFQMHKSGYTVDELRGLGFEVKGLGLKVPGYYLPSNTLISTLVQIATYPARLISYYHPRLAYDLIAIYHSGYILP